MFVSLFEKTEVAFLKKCRSKGQLELKPGFWEQCHNRNSRQCSSVFSFCRKKRKAGLWALQSRLYENEQWGSLITQEPGKQELLDNWGFMSKMEMCKTREAWEHSSRLTYFYCDAPGLSTSSSLWTVTVPGKMALHFHFHLGGYSLSRMLLNYAWTA